MRHCGNTKPIAGIERIGFPMFEMTVRQRLAALVLLLFLALGGLLLYLRGNLTVAEEFPLEEGVAQLFVHVCGAVHKPGVFQCKPGLRKFEAIEKAGGALPGADLSRVNLAEYAEDGEQIYIPLQGEAVKTARRSGSKKTAATPKTPAAGKQQPEVRFPVDLNVATAEQLEAVPGIGPAMAARIVQYRTEHGPFAAYQDLGNVSGIGPKKLENFQAYLSVP